MIRIGWFSPVSVHTGVAHFSRSVLNAMRIAFSDDEVEVVVLHPPSRGETLDMPYQTMGLSPDTAPSATEALYDVPVYNVGNSAEHHELIIRALMSEPGVVILHDYVYQDYLLGLHARDGRASQAFGCLAWAIGGPASFDALADSHILACDRQAADSGRWQSWSAEYPFCDSIARLGYGAIVHSRYADEALGSTYPGARIRLFLPRPEHPHPYGPARRAPSQPDGHRLHLVFSGRLGPNKSLGLLVAAFRACPRLRELYRVTIVGFGSAEEVADLCDVIGSAGVSDVFDVRIGLAADRLDRVISTADVFFNLRHPNTEGASAALVEQMGYGRASIVYATGSFAEVPADACYPVAPANDVDALSRCLLGIAQDRDGLAARGRRALAVVEPNSADAYSKRLVAFIQENRDDFARRRHLLLARRNPTPQDVSSLDRTWLRSLMSARRWASGVHEDDFIVPDGLWTASPRDLGRYASMNLMWVRLDSNRTEAIGEIIGSLRRAHAIEVLRLLARLSRRARYGTSSREPDFDGPAAPVLDVDAWRILSLQQGEQAITLAREALGIAGFSLPMGLLDTLQYTHGFRSMVRRMVADGNIQLDGGEAALAFRRWLESAHEDVPPLVPQPQLTDIIESARHGGAETVARFRGFGPMEDTGIWTTADRATIAFRPTSHPVQMVDGALSILPPGADETRRVRITVSEVPSGASETIELRRSVEDDPWFAWSVTVDGFSTAMEVAFSVDRLVSPQEAMGLPDARYLGVRVHSLRFSSGPELVDAGPSP